MHKVSFGKVIVDHWKMFTVTHHVKTMGHCTLLIVVPTYVSIYSVNAS